MFTWLHQFFCSHEKTYIKTNGDRLYTECQRCGKASPGVLTGNAILRDFRPERVREGRAVRAVPVRNVMEQMEDALTLDPAEVAALCTWSEQVARERAGLRVVYDA